MSLRAAMASCQNKPPDLARVIERVFQRIQIATKVCRRFQLPLIWL